MSLSNLRMILRIIISNRRSTVINFLGLVLGLSAFIIIFSWIRTEYSVDRYHDHKDRLYQLAIQFPEGILDANTPYALAPAMKDVFPEIEAFTRLVRIETQVSSSFDFYPENPDNEPVYETSVARVDLEFFTMVTHRTIYGIAGPDSDRPEGIILSREISEKYFPEGNPVGKQIRMNGGHLLEVTAVIEIPEQSQFHYDLFLPTHHTLRESWNWRDPSFILLDENSDPEEFRKKIQPFMIETSPYPLIGEYILRIVPVAKANLVFGKRKELLIFCGIAVLILLLAAINYMNLSMANYSRRIREMGIRKINGSTPEMLRRQLLGETLILSATAMLVALVLAEILLPLLAPFLDTNLQIGYKDNPLIIPGFILTILLFSLLASAYPALVLTRGNPTTILRDSFIKGKKRSTMLLVSVIFQFTISLTLLIFALFVYRQLHYMKHEEPGLNIENVVKVQLNQQLALRFQEFLDELESHPGILETTAGQANPVNEDFKTNVEWADRDEATSSNFRYSICLPDFPSFFGHEIIYGRTYNDSILADRFCFLINETACKRLNKDNPVGDKLSMWGHEGEVLGVFRDFHHSSLHREILPHVINTHPDNYRNLRYVFVRMNGENQEEILDFIKTTFRDFAGDYPFAYTYLSEEMEQLYDRDRRVAGILVSFTLLALLISCLGIYGMARYSAEKRTRDLAIRRVYGASYITIIRLANAEMLQRTGLSLVLSLPLAYLLLERWLRSFAFRTDLSWWVFALGAGIGVAISISATMSGVWKSMKQDPSLILKQH